SGRAAILVHDHRHVRSGAQHLAEQAVDPLRLRHIIGPPTALAQGRRLGAAAQQVHRGDDADNVGLARPVDREAREAALLDERDRVLRRGAVGRRRDLAERHHHLADGRVTEVEDVVDQLGLLRRHLGLAGLHLEQRLQLLARDEGARVRLRTPYRRSVKPTTRLAKATKGMSTTDVQRRGRESRRMRLVAHARATAFGMISPNTSMTGVRTRVTTTGARPPSVGRRLHVVADAATMCATVTPIIAVESTRSGWRKASRYAAAVALPCSARCRSRGRFAAMNAISAAEKNIVATRHTVASQSMVTP